MHPQVADKILTTGKYLNVMAECGREVHFPVEDTLLIYTSNHSEYAHIENVLNSRYSYT